MAPKPIEQNTLFFGDNLIVLREHIPDESIELIYLDPPFNSNRSYNVLFKEEGGKESEAQIQAFDDAWHWDRSAIRTYQDILANAPLNICNMIDALHKFIGENQMMAYLVMMTTRLVELRRVLKPTGSIYLHCDTTASHYLKVILDTIFGPQSFQNEVVWKRTSAHSSAKRYGPVHDVLLFYTKSKEFTWNQQYMPYDQEYIETFFDCIDDEGRRYKRTDLSGAGIRGGATGNPWRGIDITAKGRHWARPPEELDELDAKGKIHWPKKEGGMPRLVQYPEDLPGVPLQDVWNDMRPIHNLAAERLGYPTQKPQALLERIIQASSNPGDVVLDPFCGCGTAIAAAEKLNRRWIGIDITYLAINLIKYRLLDMFPSIEINILGEPEDLASARQLAKQSRYQFQWWALSLVGARPMGGEEGSRSGKKGSDKGIDGVINFVENQKMTLKQVLVQVKSGYVNNGQIRDFRGTVEREKAPIGVFITLESPTRDMMVEAASVEDYHSETWQRDYPRIQILTIEQLLKGAKVQMPPAHGTFQKAQKAKRQEGVQGELNI